MHHENDKGRSSRKHLPFTPGSVVAGQYTVVDCLGIGSTSTVYRVRHSNFGEQDLVLKVLHPEVLSDDTVSQRFQMELLASYEVNHPNVIRSFEFVRDEGLLGYTMEYAAGGDLRQRMSNQRTITIDEILAIARQLCLGLAAIHDRGIIHRDLKPENIFFAKDNVLKIADFGIARTQTGRSLTKHGEVLGAIDFCSPEYIESGKFDQRSDIYALGLILYEMVTGRPAFVGESPMDILMRRMTNDPVPPRRYRSDCPPVLNAVIMQAVRRNPDERYQRASEILEDLDRPYQEDDEFPEVKDKQALRLGTRDPVGSSIFSEALGEQHDREIEKQAQRYVATRPDMKTLAGGAAALVLLGVLVVASLFSSDETQEQQVPASEHHAKRVAEPVAEPIAEVAKPPVSAAPPAKTVPETRPVVAASAPVSPAANPPAPEIKFEAEPETIVAADEPSQPLVAETTSTWSGRTHRILEGETPIDIARKYGVPVKQLMKLNGLRNPRTLQIGTELKIP